MTVDLPCDDPAATTLDNAEQVVGALSGAETEGAAGDDVVVVGHSLGGIVAAVIPLLRPIRRVVFLTALIPRPGRSLGEVMSSEPDTTTEEFNALPRHIGQGGAVTWDPAVAGPFFYRACPPGTADWAGPKLRTQVWTTSREPCPLDKWPDCELASIVCADDELLRPTWSRRIARDVLHVDPIEPPGGHFPMLGIPTQLADTLARM